MSELDSVLMEQPVVPKPELLKNRAHFDDGVSMGSTSTVSMIGLGDGTVSIHTLEAFELSHFTPPRN